MSQCPFSKDKKRKYSAESTLSESKKARNDIECSFTEMLTTGDINPPSNKKSKNLSFKCPKSLHAAVKKDTETSNPILASNHKLNDVTQEIFLLNGDNTNGILDSQTVQIENHVTQSEETTVEPLKESDKPDYTITSPNHEANNDEENQDKGSPAYKGWEIAAPGIMEVPHLPHRWFPINHKSGIKVYWNPDLRLATLSPPYCINSRREAIHHRIPLAAIPCLAYRNAIDKEKEKNLESEEKPAENVKDNSENIEMEIPTNLIANQSTIESTTQENQKDEASTSVAIEVCNEASPAPPDLEKEVTPPDVPSLDPLAMDETDREEGECSSDEEAAGRNKTTSSSTRSTQKKSDITMVDTDGEVTKPKETPNAIDECQSLPSNTSQTDEANKTNEKMAVTVLETSVVTPESLPKIASLSCEEVREYCDKLFTFRAKPAFHKKMNFIRRRRQANNVAERKKREDMTDDALDEAENSQSVHLETEVQLPPDATKIANSITYKKKVGNVIKEGVINVKGKSFIGLLHEYCQVVLHEKIQFSEEASDNARAPYRVTVLLNEVPHGLGEGDSKKAAKANAAENTLRMLINDFDKVVASSNSSPPSDLTMFDSISISDPRVMELSHNVNLPNPSLILDECLKRNCYSKEKSNIQMLPGSKGKQLFIMELGKHKVEISCRTKRDGKQLASQAMLQKLHPNLHSWGAILRLYGPGSKPSIKDDLDEIKGIQNKQKGFVKTGLISVLKNKMRELAKQWEENGEQNKGKFCAATTLLPQIDFHPDAFTGLYSVTPEVSTNDDDSTPQPDSLKLSNASD